MGDSAARAPEPRIRVAALLLLDGKVVLVRHRHGDRTYHLLPGGGVEAGETLHDALAREVAEETGVRITPGELLFVSDAVDPRGHRHVLHITFRVQPADEHPEPIPQDPTIEAVDLVDPAELASLDLRPPIATEITTALRSESPTEARYLGSLWAEEV